MQPPGFHVVYLSIYTRILSVQAIKLYKHIVWLPNPFKVRRPFVDPMCTPSVGQIGDALWKAMQAVRITPDDDNAPGCGRLGNNAPGCGRAKQGSLQPPAPPEVKLCSPSPNLRPPPPPPPLPPGIRVPPGVSYDGTPSLISTFWEFANLVESYVFVFVEDLVALRGDGGLAALILEKKWGACSPQYMYVFVYIKICMCLYI